MRNGLMGEKVTDVDIATTTLPDETMRRAKAAGFKVVPTGYDHGTITVIARGKPYEVTTLRADVETFGRHARVVFGRDWTADAERRDFTINALYAEPDGRVIDLVGGLADLRSRTVRFIGEPESRIREDYLRILRFFRFYAWYGTGRPDAEGLKACARLKGGMSKLSAERIWIELKKLFSAPDPSRSLLWMRQTGVLTQVVPESEKWGIDAIPSMIAAERDLGWTRDPLLRLAAILPPDPERVEALAKRLRFSKAETAALAAWAEAPEPDPKLGDDEFAEMLYRSGTQGIKWGLKIGLAKARAHATHDDRAFVKAAAFQRLLDMLSRWKRPVFPIKGKDLIARGLTPGEQLGAALKNLEEKWIASGFSLTREALLEEY